nr:MAG TPA: hypothetical protein [Caudoviricetes sp.]
MNLRVLRPADGIMMKLVKYNLIDKDSTGTGGDDNTTTLPHNHVLREASTSDADLQPKN